MMLDWRDTMPTEKKSSYRGFTEAQARAHKKYISQFVEVKVRMEPDHRESVRAHAEAQGESLNGFINRAIDETMQRDGGADHE
jgi:predicted HicB family RNase H-like nuclease